MKQSLEPTLDTSSGYKERELTPDEKKIIEDEMIDERNEARCKITILRRCGANCVDGEWYLGNERERADKGWGKNDLGIGWKTAFDTLLQRLELTDESEFNQEDKEVIERSREYRKKSAEDEIRRLSQAGVQHKENVGWYSEDSNDPKDFFGHTLKEAYSEFTKGLENPEE